jgi:tripartite ATP-independent transporter DctP family solute receptor
LKPFFIAFIFYCQRCIMRHAIQKHVPRDGAGHKHGPIPVLLSALLLSFLLAGCGNSDAPAPSGSGGTQPAATAEPIILKYTHNAGTGQSIDLASVMLADLVKERTDGRVVIQVFPNNVMGPEVACRDMLVAGTTDMTAMGAGILSNWSGAIQIVQNLYSFEDEGELMEVMTGPFGQKYFVDAFLAEQNIRVLDQWPQSARQLISKKPVRSVADLQGLKVRTPAGIPVWEAGWNTLGVLGLSLALDEAFTGLQQGVCDAVEMPLEFIYAYRFAEEAKYLTMTNHIAYTQFIMINENSWKKISPGDQQIIMTAVKEAGAFAHEKRLEADAQILDDLRAQGVEVIELSPEVLARFQEMVQPLYVDLMSNWNQTIYDDFMKARTDYRNK